MLNRTTINYLQSLLKIFLRVLMFFMKTKFLRIIPNNENKKLLLI